jgi:hypothetical protein
VTSAAGGPASGGQRSDDGPFRAGRAQDAPGRRRTKRRLMASGTALGSIDSSRGAACSSHQRDTRAILIERAAVAVVVG